MSFSLSLQRSSRRFAALGVVFFAGLSTIILASCGGSASSPQSGSAPAAVITGAGATFPYPLYSQWAYQYGPGHGVQLNYQSIGSGGGIAQIKARTVDFGASDAPLSGAELDSDGLVQFPMVIGGVVPVVHIAGVAPGRLKLSPELLADIFIGVIVKWNDPRIAAENVGISLPEKDITVVRRSDGSGTTWIFTSYLTAVSPSWKEKIGAGKAVAWPVGVGGKGNEGVANYVERIDGAIGYVEYAYAVENHMADVQLKNRDGAYVAASFQSFQAAAANADWQGTPGFGVVLVNQTGTISWPITGATFILMHRHQADLARTRLILDFFSWCYTAGGEQARKLNYVPLPPVVYEAVQKSWATFTSAAHSPE